MLNPIIHNRITRKDTHHFTVTAIQLTGCWLLRRTAVRVGAGRPALTAHGDTHHAIASDQQEFSSASWPVEPLTNCSTSRRGVTAHEESPHESGT